MIDSDHTARTDGRGRRWVAGILVVLGGGLVALAPFLTFYTLAGAGEERRVNGFHRVLGEDGWFFLGLGLGLALLGLLCIGARSPTARRVLGVGGLIAAGFAVYGAIVDLTEEIPPDMGLTLTPEIGLFIGLGGSIVALIGSVMAIAARREHVETEPPPPPPPPPGETGAVLGQDEGSDGRTGG